MEKRRQEITEPREESAKTIKEEVIASISEAPSPKKQATFDLWTSAWLVIFVFLLIATSTITGLSLLFGMVIGAYLYLWGILGFWVVIYLIYRIVEVVYRLIRGS